MVAAHAGAAEGGAARGGALGVRAGSGPRPPAAAGAAAVLADARHQALALARRKAREHVLLVVHLRVGARNALTAWTASMHARDPSYPTHATPPPAHNTHCREQQGAGVVLAARAQVDLRVVEGEAGQGVCMHAHVCNTAAVTC